MVEAQVDEEIKEGEKVYHKINIYNIGNIIDQRKPNEAALLAII